MNETGAARAFTPEPAGTPESLWADWLSGAETWIPPAGPLCVVSPHPDDEILGAGGLIRMWAEAGFAVTVVSVTDGEGADRHWPGLGAMRRHELNSALRRLAARHVALMRLGVADGEVQRQQHRLRHFLASVVDGDTTLIAPYEHDGHPDHDAAGAVCVDLARAQGLRLARYPVWRWHHGDPRPLRALRWGKFPLDADARRAKAQALQRFSSQHGATEGEPSAGGASITEEESTMAAAPLCYFERPFEAFILDAGARGAVGARGSEA